MISRDGILFVRKGIITVRKGYKPPRKGPYTAGTRYFSSGRNIIPQEREISPQDEIIFRRKPCHQRRRGEYPCRLPLYSAGRVSNYAGKALLIPEVLLHLFSPIAMQCKTTFSF